MREFNLTYIKERRIKLGKSLQTVATSLDMKNASTYMKYENGTYAFKAEQLPTLAVVLECEVADFFKKEVSKIEI